jgi:hypothetical protein
VSAMTEYNSDQAGTLGVDHQVSFRMTRELQFDGIVLRTDINRK